MCSSAHLRRNAKIAFFPDIANRCIAACIPFVPCSSTPRYLKEFSCSIASPSYWKAWHTDLPTSNTTTLVFLTFTVNWRSQQKAYKTSSCFCNPAGVCDMRAKSSAYRSKRTTSCPNIGGASPSKAFNYFSRPSMKRPNNSRLRGHPCFTPMGQRKVGVSPSSGWCRQAWSWRYMERKHSSIHPLMPSPSSTYHNRSLGTVSKVFLKSTKQMYSCFFWNLACSVKVRRINKLFVVLKSFLKLACPFACKSLVSAHWLMWDSRIITNTLAKTGPIVIPL